MPTMLVRLHLALIGIIALLGISFLADPCPSGGDLCLGGVAGLTTLGVAGIGAVALVVWRAGGRASAMLLWDVVFVTAAGFVAIQYSPYASPAILLGAVAMLLLGVPGAIAAARVIVAHRIERALTIAALVALGAVAGEGFVAVAAVGLLALVAGWGMGRNGPAVTAPSPAAPPAPLPPVPDSGSGPT